LLLEEKRALRHTMMARRQEVSPAERARASAAVSARLQALPEVDLACGSGGIIAGFVALAPRGEIDPEAGLWKAAGDGARVVFPRVSVEAPRLRFHWAEPGNPREMIPGPYGLLEPAVTTPEIDAAEIDVMIVPGLAFDRQGNRLGYGGGYYDEAAGKLRAAGRGLLVGVGYDFQLVDRCPAGEADVAVDCVVTDSQVVRCVPAPSSSPSSSPSWDGGGA
jgi:5-formyltetrahydrofolate cyclo-ligase